jgi:hypothetical protein
MWQIWNISGAVAEQEWQVSLSQRVLELCFLLMSVVGNSSVLCPKITAISAFSLILALWLDCKRNAQLFLLNKRCGSTSMPNDLENGLTLRKR